MSGLLERGLRSFGKGLAEATTDPELREARDRAYEDRNVAVIALAASIPEFSGYYIDEDHPGWPVVWAELPAGSGEDRFAAENRRQVAWHVSPERRNLVEDALDQREPPEGWDGHDRDEKNQRLAEFALDA